MANFGTFVMRPKEDTTRDKLIPRKLFSEDFDVTEAVQRAFDINGYVIIRGLLDGEEVGKLRAALESDQGIMAHRYTRDDGEGRKAKVALWNHPGNDVTGVIARSQKVAGTFEKLLGGEIYHYHSKLIMKEAHTGGAHIWHQDYGYWYENGCIFPNMGTTWIAVDEANKDNGCLKILQGSHRVGRVTHVRVGDQAGADMERVRQVQKWCPLLHVEIDPGDALFFHCNVLHRSDHNNSDRRRWAFLVSFNRADNNPVYSHHHPQYTPLHKVPSCDIRECTTYTNMEGKDFFAGPSVDDSLARLDKQR